MAMTYREFILKMMAEHRDLELDQDMTVQIGPNEFIAISGIGMSKEGDAADGVLDHGHLYFIPANQDWEPEDERDAHECEVCGSHDDVMDYRCGHCSFDWYVKFDADGCVRGPMNLHDAGELLSDQRVHGHKYRQPS